MKKSLISSHSAYHRPRDKLVTYYCTAYDLDVQRQNMARDKPLAGRVTYANGDAQEFTDAEAFLECVREEYAELKDRTINLDDARRARNEL